MEQSQRRPDSDPDLFDEALIARFAGDQLHYERGWLKDRIEASLDDPDCRIVLITGDPGAGKTTLMARLAQQRPDWLRYFIRRVDETDSARHYAHEGGLASFLTVTGFQLASLRPSLFPSLGEHNEIVVEAEAETVGPGRQAVLKIDELVTHLFRKMAIKVSVRAGRIDGDLTVLEIGKLVTDAAISEPEALEAPALLEPLDLLEPGERIVILLDGLDELQFRTAASDVGRWLTAHQAFRPNLRIVVSSRPTDSLALTLLSSSRTDVRRIDISGAIPEIAADAKGFTQTLALNPRFAPVLAAHSIAAERFVLQLSQKSGGNFQYLAMIRRLLEAEAANPGNIDAGQPGTPDLNWLDDLERLPASLPGLYASLLWGLHNRTGGTPATRSDWDLIYRPLLGLLAVERAPLAAGQFRAFGGIAVTEGRVQDALERLSFFLHRYGDPGRYELFHASMADFILDQAKAGSEPPLHCQALAWHRQIAEQALRLRQEGGSWKQADPYLLAFLPGHAAEAGLLDDLVEDPAFLLAADPAGLLPEAGAVTRAIPAMRIYERTVALRRADHEADLLAHLELYARQAGLDEFAGKVAALRHGGPWLIDFTLWNPVDLRQSFGRPGGEVSAIAMARDLGRRPIAVTGGTDGQIRVWDLLARDEVRKVSPLPASEDSGSDQHRPTVTALAAGELISGEPVAVTGGADGAVRAWNLNTGERIAGPLTGIENSGWALATTVAAGTPIAVCRIGDELRAWDLASGSPAGPPFPAEGVRENERVAVAQCGARLLIAAVAESSTGAGRVRAWDARTGERYGPEMRAGDDWITAIALADLGGEALIAVADGERGRQVFSAATGELRGGRAERFEAGLVTALAIGTLDGQAVLAEANDSGEIRLRDPVSLKLLGEPVPAHAREITALGIGPGTEGNWLLSCGSGLEDPEGENGRSPLIRFWNSDRPSRRSLGLRPASPLIRPRERARSIAVARLASRVEVLTTDGRSAARWDATSGSRASEPECGQNSRVHAVAVATTGGAAGRTFAIGATYDDPTIRTWDLTTGKPAPHPLTGQPLIQHVSGHIRGLAAGHLAGRPVGICAEWSDIHVWDLETGEPAGPGQIAGPTNILSVAAGQLARRPVIACVGTADSRQVHVLDLETGIPLDPPHPGFHGRAEVVTIGGPAGQELVVSGSTARTILAWKPAPAGAAPALIHADDVVTALAAASLDGMPVAVCSGRSGEIRLVDLTAKSSVSRIGRVIALAVCTTDGREAVVCGCDDGVLVLDVTTGKPAAPVPAAAGTGWVKALAVGELHGRPVAVTSGRESHAWYLDSGEPLGITPGWPGDAVCLAIGTFGGRTVVAAGARREQVVLADLETGQPLGEPITGLREQPSGLALTTVSGYPVILVKHSMQIQPFFVRLPGMPDPPADWVSGFSAQDQTPPPPPLLRKPRLTRHPHDAGWSLAAGIFRGQPIVISGHDHGEIDLITIASALPLSPQLGGPDSPIGALAYAPIGARAVLAAGAFNGLVMIADLNDLSEQVAIRTQAPVRALALGPPDRCLIGTDKGLISVRIPALAQDPPANPAHRVTFPYDVRAARACPSHGDHRQLADQDGTRVTRLCIKSIRRSGDPRTVRNLGYAAGHCFVFPDRLEITTGGLAGDQAEAEVDLMLPLRDLYVEPVEDPDAHQADGCHFGVVIHRDAGSLALSCYRRSERDWLIASILQLRDNR